VVGYWQFHTLQPHHSEYWDWPVDIRVVRESLLALCLPSSFCTGQLGLLHRLGARAGRGRKGGRKKGKIGGREKGREGKKERREGGRKERKTREGKEGGRKINISLLSNHANKNSGQ